ncbi:ATP-binding cassette domain-containing protein [Nitratireductor sp. CAU 1489]|uniref:ATP-binding cassette domain-containing protein n=1 Tax=Nitratireductor arenosus TaxID=2682096 RepID=A0A844QHB9_9HYPH|nr:ATP-binding cassette domain-containing protein [Nitratireductor arenosus]MVA98695.1 ATP-binding cassette domain-containing protein [Nitratireductor arenosus]
MNEQSLFTASELRAGYGRVPVLDGVTFSARQAEIVGLLGPNGMGKTTLLKTLIGVLPCSSGSILLDGVELRTMPAHERARLGIGYVPQGREIFAGLTVRENIAFGAASSGRARRAVIERAVADFPVLERLLDRKGGALSGGEQQILALARALAGDPRVLLLDEPTEGVAPAIVEDIERQLIKLARERSLAVVVVEQDVDFLATVSDRILQMQKGRIVREVPAADLAETDIFAPVSQTNS